MSTRGLELACRRSFSDDQIAAAVADLPLPVERHAPQKLPRLGLEELGAEVVRTEHKPYLLYGGFRDVLD